MTEIEDELNAAREALAALANGRGLEAAAEMEAAFGRAGEEIEAVLTRAARTGELEFEKMAERILRELARIAAEAAFSTEAAATNTGGGASGAAIGEALVKAVSKGRRFI